MERTAYYDQGVFDIAELDEWSIPHIVRLQIDANTKTSRIALHHNAHVSQFQIHCHVPVQQLIESIKCFTNQRLLFTCTGINMVLNGNTMLAHQSILCKETSHVLITWSPILTNIFGQMKREQMLEIDNMQLTPLSKGIILPFLQPKLKISVTYDVVHPYNPILKNIAMVRKQYEIFISGASGSLINRIKGEPQNSNEMMMVWIVVLDQEGRLYTPLERLELMGNTEMVFWPEHCLHGDFYYFQRERKQRLDIWESVEYFDLHIFVDRSKFQQPFTCFVLIQY
jgi:hypothetical protein